MNEELERKAVKKPVTKMGRENIVEMVKDKTTTTRRKEERVTEEMRR